MKRQKTGGRQIGSKNRTSSEIREALVIILNNNLDRLQEALERMEDKEAAKLIIALSKHLTYPEASPERLTEAQLIQLHEYLKDKYNEKHG